MKRDFIIFGIGVVIGGLLYYKIFAQNAVSQT